MNNIQTAKVVEAFDNVANIFEISLENDITRQLRQKVYATIHSLVPHGASILDINCGIGIDAVALAQEGYNVLGVDISTKMIEQSRERAVRHGTNNVEFLETSFEDLSSFSGKTFDLVLSNFGGLNCVSSLTSVAEQVARVTKPNGYFVAVVMPPVSLWELLAGFARFNFTFAFRRFRRNVPATGFGGKSFTVSYYSPRKFASTFSQWFELRQIRGFNIISPPPHATRFAASFPRLSKWLERVEVAIASFPVFRSVGDHYMMILRRVEKPKNLAAETPNLPNITLSSAQIYSEISNIRDSVLRFDHDSEYGRYLKNKRVAVVGPARTLIGKKQGRFIDSHDIVVRFNDAFQHLPIPPSLSDDIGTRADILYCNQVILRKNILQQQGISHERFARIYDEVGIKHLVCTNNSLSFNENGSPSPTCDRRDKQLIFDFKKFLSRHGIQAGFRLVYTASEKLIQWMNGNFGRTGFIAILDLLHFDISRLYVTGMTFYHGGGHLYSPNSLELHPLKNRDGTWARDNSGLGHNSYMELELMKLMVQCFRKKLELDENLLALLEHDGS